MRRTKRSPADLTLSRRKRAGTRRNKKLKNVGSFASDRKH